MPMVAFRKGTYTYSCGSGAATVYVPRDVAASEVEYAARRIWKEISDGKKKSDAA